MKISFERYAMAENNYEGWCVQCQSFTRETTEPDAEGYDCPVCGENTVIGVLEALMTGNITVKSYVAYGGYRCKIVSADAYFVRIGNGTYAFDPTLLSQAHAECFKSFIEALRDKTDLVIVDNTNSTAVEMSPYMLGASAYGYEAEYVTIHCDPIAAAARNIHGVSEQVVVAMHERMLNERLPPWWKSAM